MSEDTIKKLTIQLDALKSENVALKARVDDLQKGFAVKVDSATLITSIQRDLLRVDDFAMSQERPTTYVLSDFNLQLKAVVTQDEQARPMFVLPSRLEEIQPLSGAMSSVNVVLKPVPLPIKPAVRPRPIDAVEGIGPAYAGRLRDLGIHTVTDLALASAQDVAKVGISRERAAGFISMAKLMVKADISGVEGVDEQAAELLVTVAKIDSKEKLSQANPEELYNMLTEAIKARKVRVPRGYSLTKEDVERWVNSAKAIVARTRTS
jgi:hypothetical protein